jgi:heme/copper-type cytochrome/quinol oxidase subunit 2
MRHNRAAKLNRNMMIMTMIMAVIVLGCVFAFMYMAF